MHRRRIAWAVSPCESGFSPLFEGGTRSCFPPAVRVCGWLRRPAGTRCNRRPKFGRSRTPDDHAVRHQIRHRTAGPALRGSDPRARRRPLHRRRQRPRPDLRGDGSQPVRPRHHPQDRRRSGAQDEGRARRLHRRRFRRRRLRHAQVHRPVQEPRRQRDEEAGAARAGDRPGALRRRSDRVCRRRHAQPGQGRRRGDRDRHRAAAGRDRSGSGRARGRAAAL